VTAAPIKVLVVDGHQTFAELLGVALAAQPNLRYIGHAGTGAEALQRVAELQPDVVLVEVELPDISGIEALEQIRAQYPRTRVVVLTAHTEPALVGRATGAGASGFLTKNGSLGDVLHAISTAHSGGMTVSAHLLTRLLKGDSGQPGSRTLTAREHDVLRLMGAGMDSRGIARRLGISVHTCRGYVKNVLAKLDAHSQLEAVAVATRRGLLAPADRD
jgi:DNA-binding NarL/FixJ family response regulator